MIVRKIILGLGVVALIGAGWMAAQNCKVPDGVGVHEGRLAPLPSSPNAVSSQTGDQSRFVEPLPMRGGLDKTRQRILAVLQSMPRAKVQEEHSGYVHAVFTSPTFRFKDDVEFLLTDGLVHFRSASRVGWDDMGVNRKRYERFRELYLKD